VSPNPGQRAGAADGPLGSLQRALRTAAATAIKLLLLLAGFVFMLSALLAAGLLALGLLTWALLRGRRPAPGVFQAYYQRARRRQRPGSEPMVVDVEAVEVVEAAPTHAARAPGGPR
jgi:hypothetical protein